MTGISTCGNPVYNSRGAHGKNDECGARESGELYVGLSECGHLPRLACGAVISALIVAFWGYQGTPSSSFRFAHDTCSRYVLSQRPRHFETAHMFEELSR